MRNPTKSHQIQVNCIKSNESGGARPSPVAALGVSPGALAGCSVPRDAKRCGVLADGHQTPALPNANPSESDQIKAFLATDDADFTDGTVHVGGIRAIRGCNGFSL